MQWHFIKNIVSCLLFETAKIRREEGGSDSITVSARVYTQDLKIFFRYVHEQLYEEGRENSNLL